PTLTAFLAYLDAAADEERGLETGQVEVDEHRVQVLTVHGAKGLEWDVVFVPGLVKDVFPTKPKTSGAWLSTLGELPFPLRGDRSALPDFEVARAQDQQKIEAARKAFLADCDAWAAREERRLAYVAVTRARELLVASGYRWADGKAPREPGEFLREIAEICRSGAGNVPVWHGELDPDAENPLASEPPSHAWPYDPLDEERRADVEDGAELVQAALAGLEAAESPPAEVLEAAREWQGDVDLLLAERARRSATQEVVVDLPAHLSVSQLVLLRRDPAALARAIRRPVPHPPDPLARRGTAFHAWLEARFGMPQLLDIDELPGAADEQAAPDDDLADLQAAFLASEWADRQPTDVEVPFELVVADVVVRGRADAVFPTTLPDGEPGIEVVDWKTGRPPTDPEEEAARAVQLAAYRLAWAEMSGLPIERVGAAFHYVRHNRTARPVDLLDREGLEALVRSIPSAEPDPASAADGRDLSV
ncbi:MAG TPA: 3'-5' exonuclease, partial [Actinopolymorphaceae bacterium]